MRRKGAERRKRERERERGRHGASQKIDGNVASETGNDSQRGHEKWVGGGGRRTRAKLVNREYKKNGWTNGDLGFLRTQCMSDEERTAVRGKGESKRRLKRGG